MKIRVVLNDPYYYSDERIIEEIKDTFQTYSVPFNRFFIDEDNDEKTDKIPLMVNGSLNKKALESASYILGLDRYTFFDLDNHDVMKWYDKYSFFDHITDFNSASRKANHLNEELYFVSSIFGFLFSHGQQSNGTRYDVKSVYKRTIDLLKEADNYLPGTFHENAELLDFQFTTKHFCHYSNIKNLVISYFELIDSYKQLFFKALHEELSLEEICEYNFLVTVLGIQDKYYHVFEYPMLYYRYLPFYRDTYKGIKSDDLFDYINIGRIPHFWACAEITQEREILQELIDRHFISKQHLMQFAREVEYFNCKFIWSDTGVKKYSSDEIEEIEFLNDTFDDEDPIPTDFKKTYTSIYVKKTSDELMGDDEYASLLMKLCSPEKMGGLINRVYIDDPDDRRSRIKNLRLAEKQFLEGMNNGE